MKEALTVLDTIYKLKDTIYLNNSLENYSDINLPQYFINEGSHKIEKLLFIIFTFFIIAMCRYRKIYIFNKKNDNHISIVTFIIFTIFSSINTTIIWLEISQQSASGIIFIKTLTYFILAILTLFVFGQFMGWIFNFRYLATKIYFNFLSYFFLANIYTSPFIIMFLFLNNKNAEICLNIWILVHLIILLVKIFKLTQILYTNRVSILYMILYLCALEFVPILIAYKYVTQYI